jgi:NAD(P)-dependent dehydrogenase (short-subunit alcohol dehydrogenase family)
MASLVRYLLRSPVTPARVIRLLRAPSLEDALAGRVVLVTGASSGIGRATALRVGAAGATVLLVARRHEALEAVRAAIVADGGEAYVYDCDLRDWQQIARLVAEILEHHEAVDVLINNAGHSIRRPIDRSYDRAHDFERSMRLNYFAPLRLILALLPAMRARSGGHIINVCTMGVQVRAPRWSAYVASKAALDAFATCLAAEVRADGVSVTDIHFPLVHTPMSAASGLYADAPGLSAGEAADTIAEAIRTRPARISARLGIAFALAWLIAPGAMQRELSRRYERSRERSELEPGGASPPGGFAAPRDHPPALEVAAPAAHR